MSKLRAVKALVAERLAAAAEEISSTVEKKLQLTSDMSPEQRRAAVHERLSAVADEIFRILEKMLGEYELEVSGSHDGIEGKRQPTSTALKTETDVHRTGGPPVSISHCADDASSEQSGSCSRVQRASAVPQIKDATTEADCEPGDHEVLSSNDSEAASEDEDGETTEKHLKSNKRRTFQRQSHDAEDYCEMCGRSFLDSAAGKKLKKQESKIPATATSQTTGRSRCRVCGKSFRYKRSFLKHVLAHERSSDLCGACGKHLDSDESLEAHLQTHDEENGRRDQTGDSDAEGSDAESPVGDSDEEWRDSEGSDGDGDGDSGDEETKDCLQKSKTKGSNKPRGAKNKDREDSTPLKYRCKVCGKHFCYRASFLKHVQEDEGDAALCGVCGKRFESPVDLRLHLQTYVRTNDCEVCGKHFDSRKQLEMHARTHTGEKPYVCSVCGKAFAQNGNLMGHMRAHTGERPYACSVCGQSFGFKEYMTAHMRIHTGEKPFLCSVCGKGFRQRGTLKTHMMIHSGESAHRCGVCDKRFYKSGALKIHMRSHTGEKPYLCNVCGKSFTASGSLTKHMGVHEGDRRKEEPRTQEATRLTRL